MEASPNRGFSENEVINHIMAIQNQINQSGSVDTENNDITLILNKIRRKEITPQKAMEIVDKMNDGRQNYH